MTKSSLKIGTNSPLIGATLCTKRKLEMGKLTTHILDTTHGTPAKHVQIDLYRRVDNGSELIKSVQTNSDGRTDLPMLDGEAFQSGKYELVFQVAQYYHCLLYTLTLPTNREV